MPYIRHITESRSADPHEVIESVKNWLLSAEPGSEGGTKEEQFLSALAPILIKVMVYGQQVEHRSENPWLDLLMAEFGNAASELRVLASKDLANRLGLADELAQMARRADEIRLYRLSIGSQSWAEFVGLVTDVIEDAARIKEAHIDRLAVSNAMSKNALSTLVKRSLSRDVSWRAFPRASFRSRKKIELARYKPKSRESATLFWHSVSIR